MDNGPSTLKEFVYQSLNRAAVERQLKHIISSVEGKGSLKNCPVQQDLSLTILPAYLGESLG